MFVRLICNSLLNAFTWVCKSSKKCQRFFETFFFHIFWCMTFFVHIFWCMKWFATGLQAQHMNLHYVSLKNTQHKYLLQRPTVARKFWYSIVCILHQCTLPRFHAVVTSMKLLGRLQTPHGDIIYVDVICGSQKTRPTSKQRTADPFSFP